MVVVDIRLKNLVELPVGLLDLRLVLFELNIDLVDFPAHRVILVENLVELLSHISEQFIEKSFVLLDLLNIEFVHDLCKCAEHLTRLVELCQIHAV